MSDSLLVEDVEPGIRVITLNRPGVLNAWNAEMRMRMAEVVAELPGADLRAVVIAGNGRAFSAGEDVRGMEALADDSTRGFRAVARHIHDVFDGIEALEVPVIAAVEGVAAGGGLELALSCDFRVVSRSARLGLPELARAKEIVMLEGMMPAERAHQLGLVTRLAEPGAALDGALEMARELKAKAPLAVGMAKLVLNSCAEADLELGRRFERLGQSVLKKTGDHLEGARAFMEKRKPDWKAR